MSKIIYKLFFSNLEKYISEDKELYIKKFDKRKEFLEKVTIVMIALGLTLAMAIMLSKGSLLDIITTKAVFIIAIPFTISIFLFKYLMDVERIGYEEERKEAIIKRNISKEEEKNKLKDVINDFNRLSQSKYCILDNEMYIFCYDKEMKMFKFFSILLSKDKKMLIVDNGSSYNKAFTIKPKTDILVNNFLVFSVTKQETDYVKIDWINNDGNAITILNLKKFDSKYYEEHIFHLKKPYDNIINRFAKIFNDVAGNFDYPEVRATEDEIKILQETLNNEKNITNSN